MSQETKLDLRPAEQLRRFFQDNSSKLLAVLPKHIDIKRYMSITLNAIWKNETLAQCEPFTLFKAVQDVAGLGLEIGSYRGQACILPYWNKKKNCFEAQAQVMYQGLIDLAARSGEVIDIRARIVYEKDQFEVEYGLDEKLIHKPTFEDAGKPTHCYAVIRYKDGTKAFEVMTKEQIEKIKNTSQAVRKGYSTPWTDPVGELEMWKKTVIKRLLKVIPKEIDKLREAINKDEELEFGEIRQSVTARLEEKTASSAKKLAEKLAEPQQEVVEKGNMPISKPVADAIAKEEAYHGEPVCPDCGYAVSVCGCKQQNDAPLKKRGRPKKEDPEQMEIK